MWEGIDPSSFDVSFLFLVGGGREKKKKKNCECSGCAFVHMFALPLLAILAYRA